MNNVKITNIVLLIAHGSRKAEGNLETEKFAKLWQQSHPNWHIDLCFIEYAPVLIKQGLENVCASAQKHNLKTINIIPLILNAAGHVKMEIPAEIAEISKLYTDINFVLCKNLGMGEEIFNVVNAELFKLNQSLAMPDPQTSSAIILGRGSSDSAANGEVAKLARWLFENNNFTMVDIAFTSVTFPRLETIVQRHIRLGVMQILIQPLYLFNGVLLDRIKLQFERLKQQYPNIAFALGERFCFQPQIFKLLDRKVSGESEKPLECERCKYRILAENEHHHDHSHTAVK